MLDPLKRRNFAEPALSTSPGYVTSSVLPTASVETSDCPGASDGDEACSALSSFAEWRGPADAGIGDQIASARIAPRTALLDGFLKRPPDNFVRNPPIARTGPFSPACKNDEPLVFSACYETHKFASRSGFSRAVSVLKQCKCVNGWRNEGYLADLRKVGYVFCNGAASNDFVSATLSAVGH
jgi:hypothetical protein